ncbi:MAG: SDR family NAD(P)-dependent oxidoreductase [Nitrospiraceae bacterium]|nr:SDR family NAD(P)-dependent oxidoreductase [Nitrospiraceae bacterium]
MGKASFRGQHVIITGGSAGIGLCMAHELARRGADLTILARGRERLDAARADLAAHGGRVFADSCDVTDAETLAVCIDRARAELGPIDGVVANSGYCHPGYFHELNPADLKRQVDVNLTGCLYTLRLTIPLLRENGGGFIAITSSPAGNAGVFGFSAYGATKAALNHLAHILRAEYARDGIRVHLLLPPDTDTPGYEREVLLYPRETKAILEGGRLFAPERVARQFADGIARNKKRITIGFEAHLLLFIVRYCPFLWDTYVRWKTRGGTDQ